MEASCWCQGVTEKTLNIRDQHVRGLVSMTEKSAVQNDKIRGPHWCCVSKCTSISNVLPKIKKFCESKNKKTVDILRSLLAKKTTRYEVTARREYGS